MPARKRTEPALIRPTQFDPITTLELGRGRHERLQYLAMVRDEWGIGNGMITPTMKIKRAAIEKTYGPHFDSWYGANAPVLWESA